jgi:Pectinacetylesterase
MSICTGTVNHFRHFGSVAGMSSVVALMLCSPTIGCKDEDGTSTDNSIDAGSDERALPPLELGKPLDTSKLADGEWTWIDFPETRCMDDSATGLGIKLNKDSDKLLIEIQGGNACFNQGSCLQVWNPDGFGESKLADAVKLGILDSEDETNPFADWNMVFIPYCSGDIFSGMAMNGSGYEGRTQAGYHNIQQYLKRLVPTFAGSSHVVVSGFSAGGFGTTLNWVQVREAFGGEVRVDALNDSGPLMASDYYASCLSARLGKLWNWRDAIPESCTDCDLETGDTIEPLVRWLIEHTPEEGGRHGLISSDDDGVIKLFFGYGIDECAHVDELLPPTYPKGLYAEGLADFRERTAGHDWAQMYELESTEHTWTTSHSLGDVVSNGVTLSDWLRDFLDRDSDWQTVLP